ncbi:BMP family ABC transporter substrate-binding protein [Bacillus sp. RG28]|uniref:BMP family ABC transporter substrate-binding protein n=1 Tax=Gottfriedia endophytica TaxID=2820819 RepID=A0A940SK71_9BACI|nr:BMP family ABC transporter substrate-binding protein [Gottfriedia endophytica]MBP0726181.1 BMP family ABC transporter substrate-binding protein [Gottfriedia endophytica]
MKKAGLVLSMALAAGTILGACGKDSGNKSDSNSKAGFKVGMVTDSGTIDDKSFNQGTWEGIQAAAKELKWDANTDTKYLKPSGESEAEYLSEIGNLNDADYKFIVTPGFKFETAIYKAQDKYPNDKFVIIDGAPHKDDKDFTPNVKKNTVSIFYAEQEAGYLAGVATALKLKTGDVGFIGGMEIPPVQKYNWGFQQGVKYANDNYGTKISIKKENVIYQGTFKDVAAGQQIAASMYDHGVRAIFCAAGGVGVGAINESKARAKAGKEAWIIGVDVDQYDEGKYDGNKSTILTSATKGVAKSAADMIKDEKDGKFPGGQTLIYDAKNDGVGLPKENPNLDSDITSKIDDVFNKIKSGEIKVSNVRGNLIK